MAVQRESRLGDSRVVAPAPAGWPVLRACSTLIAMGSEAKKLLEQALRLPKEERARVIAGLIESLDEAANRDVEAQWDEEIAKRIADFKSGAVKPIPWPEARRRILDEL
jgi:putative addiction module component (TIGR02574 family)